ncbi:MAG: hypothetical protein QXN49_06480 [Archaeoglobaceae archaeon]
MKKAVLIVGLLVLAMGSASAADFSVPATDFAKLMINNTIAQMQQVQSILSILDAANGTTPAALKFQNVWGVAYGGMVLASINNQVTGLTLEAILNNSYSYSGMKLYELVGASIDYLGSNASVVFGDPEGTKGLAKLLAAQVTVLGDKGASYAYNYNQAYATELAKTMYAGVLMFIKMAQAIPAAFT